jgi:hypothetical protein
MGDASQTTQKRKSKVIYTNQINSLIANNSNNSVLATCTTAPEPPVSVQFQFPNFDNKLTFFEGKNECNGCTCPKTGWAAR